MFIPIQPPFVYRNDRFWPIQKYWWTEYVESCSIPSHRGTPAETCGRGEDKDIKRLNAVDEHQRESGVSVNSFHSLLWNVYGVYVVFSGRYPFPIFPLPTKYCLILPQPDETYDDGVLWWMCIGNWLCEMMWYAMAKMCLITCVYIYREREVCVCGCLWWNLWCCWLHWVSKDGKGVFYIVYLVCLHLYMDNPQYKPLYIWGLSDDYPCICWLMYGLTTTFLWLFYGFSINH